MSISSSERGVTGRTLRGHLDLRADLRPDGVPHLSRQSFRAPVHLSKAHLESGALVVHLVNPTAGFFDGDRLELDVTAGAGCPLVLSTPSASRVHRARGEEAAVCHQRLVVEEGGFLEWIPEPFIPQAGARYHQRTELDLRSEADLIYFDWIAPGRVARGEAFAYASLRCELDLRVEGALVARERYTLRPDDPGVMAMRERFPEGHFVTVYSAGIGPDHWPAAELDALGSERVYIGHGPLEKEVRMVRAICADSLSARALMGSVRDLLYAALKRPMPRLGRHDW